MNRRSFLKSVGLFSGNFECHFLSRNSYFKWLNLVIPPMTRLEVRLYIYESRRAAFAGRELLPVWDMFRSGSIKEF
jgi:hypothetical protein